jgi:hypothetical protein
MTPKKPRASRKPELSGEETPKALPRKKSTKTNPELSISTLGSESVNQLLSDDEIARKAYSLWEHRGRPVGSPEEDWYRAKDELIMKATA